MRRHLEGLTATSCSVCTPPGQAVRFQGAAKGRGHQGPNFRSMGQLQQHALHAHGRALCSLCREHRKVFPGEQLLYTQ
eukprot:2579443-Pyramimonas_sp.AAC.1